MHKAELKLYAKGLWEVPDRWLNLFVSVSCITVLGRTVGVGGPILIWRAACAHRSAAILLPVSLERLVGGFALSASSSTGCRRRID